MTTSHTEHHTGGGPVATSQTISRGTVMRSAAAFRAKITSLGLLAAWPSTALAQNADGSVAFDPRFGVPVLPNLAYNEATASVIMIVLLLGALSLLAFAVREAIRFKEILPVTIVLGSAALDFPEVYVDVLGGIYWPWTPDHVAFTIMGRPMTWFTVAVWFASGAIGCLGSYALFRRNVSTKVLWTALGVNALFNVVLEEVLLNIPGLYTYYGNQPLVLLTKFPFWWAGVNGGGLFAAAALLYRYRAHLGGWRALAPVAVIPLVYLAMFGFTAMPATIVVNGRFSWLATQIGGIATLGLCLVGAALVMHLILQRNPFDMNSRSPTLPETDGPR